MNFLKSNWLVNKFYITNQTSCGCFLSAWITIETKNHTVDARTGTWCDLQRFGHVYALITVLLLLLWNYALHYELRGLLSSLQFSRKDNMTLRSNTMGVSFLHAMIWLLNKSEMTIIYIHSLIPALFFSFSIYYVSIMCQTLTGCGYTKWI